MKAKLIISILLIITGVFTTKAQYTKLLDFAGTANGSSPLGYLYSDGTFLYGVTQGGGTYNKGLVFKIKQDGTAFDTLINFNGTNGSTPLAALISDGTFLYGTTEFGGAFDNGTVFKIKPDGTGFVILLSFDTTNGFSPYDALLYDGTFLYGTTENGGTSSLGVIFKIKPDGTGYSKLLDFNTANGSNLWGSLVSDGIYLYGMSGGGGTNNDGLIFKIKPDGTGFTDLLDFSGAANGKYPLGSLIYDGTFLYGMTQHGGTSDNGLVFRIKTDGTGYTDLLDFSGTANGSQPRGSLITDGIYLYGMTIFGGSGSCPSGCGLVFKIKLNGTGYVDLFDFTGPSGQWPYSSLIIDGAYLYGMTSCGGANADGTIFKFHDAGMGITDNKAETDFNVSPNPANELITANIEGITDFENACITLFDYSGRLLLKEKIIQSHTQINVAGLSNGIYFVQLQSGNKIVNQKFIKE